MPEEIKVLMGNDLVDDSVLEADTEELENNEELKYFNQLEWEELGQQL